MVTKISRSWGVGGRAEAWTLTLYKGWVSCIDILKGHLWDLLFLKPPIILCQM